MRIAAHFKPVAIANKSVACCIKKAVGDVTKAEWDLNAAVDSDDVGDNRGRGVSKVGVQAFCTPLTVSALENELWN
jgi:hypothetical protein